MQLNKCSEDFDEDICIDCGEEIQNCICFDDDDSDDDDDLDDDDFDDYDNED